MKYKRLISYLGSVLLSSALFSCTDLTETVYDQIVTENYYNTRQDVIRSAFRPFEHAFWSIGPRFTINEETSDQLGTWNRDGWWVDGQVWQRYHYHTWTIDDDITEWSACFTGIMYASSVLDDFESLGLGSTSACSTLTGISRWRSARTRARIPKGRCPLRRYSTSWSRN